MRKLLVCVIALSLLAPVAQAAYTPEPAPAPAPATPTSTPAPATSTPTPTPAPATSTPTPTPAPATPTPTPATATSTPTPEKPLVTVQTELARINPMLYSNDFRNARAELVKINRAFPNNADVNNLLGYTSRKLKLYSSSASYYTKALQINPNHLGALEYQGELFVVTRKIAAAKSNLAKLMVLCGVNCVEYQDLKKAIGSKK